MTKKTRFKIPDIQTKTCSMCTKEVPVTLMHGKICHDCSEKPYQKVEVEFSKKKMSDEQRERKKREIQAAQAEERRQFNAKEAAKKELARRQLANKRLLPFVQMFNEDYMPGWVHIDICRRLEEFSAAVERKESPRLMLFMPPRHGKNLADSTPVLTTNGWKKHGDIKTGDYVYHPSGESVKVLAVSGKETDDCELTFSNGDKIVCHDNHEWTVFDRRKNKWRTVETSEIMGDYWIGKQGKRGGRSRWFLPDTLGVEFETKPLVVDPYVLGVWLGDGTCGEPTLTNSKDDAEVFQEAFKQAGYPCTNIYVHKKYGTHRSNFYKTDFIKHLRKIGVLKHKHIPTDYLINSRENRKELLAGLIDTDGHVENNTGRCRYVTTSKDLRDGVYDLCTTLGYRPYVTEAEPKTTSSGVHGRQTVYTVGFQPFESLPTRISSKQVTKFAVRRRVSVRDVKKVAGEKGHCIQVDSEDGLYLAGKNLTPTHNSELASKTFPAWHLGRNPKHEVIASSYAADLAMDFSRKVRGLIGDSTYKNIFPKTSLDKKSQAAERWNTSAGGGYVAAGVGGAITGRGAHIGIIDDPIKNREDAESPTNRQKIKDWYTSTFYTRLAPGGGVLVILTRWHDDDLAGWLIEQEKEGGDQWEIVRYPAIAVDNEKFRVKGQPLHPDRYPLDALERIKRAVGDRDWSALYQQNPVPDEGAYFQKDWFKYEDNTPPLDELKVYQAWDFAIGQQEHNDYTVGATIGIDKKGAAHVLNIARGKWDALEIVETMIDQYVAFKPQRVGVEKGQIEMAIGPMLKKRMRERQVFFSTEDLKTGRRDKQARARPLQGRLQQGMIYFPKHAEFMNEARNEMLRFPTGKHDDIVDALAWAFQMLDMFTTVVDPKPKPKKSWRDKLAKYTNSKSKRNYMRA